MSIHHQRNVIGGLCYESTADATWLSCQQSGLSTEHFTDPDSFRIFSAVVGLKASGRHLNPATMIDYARANQIELDWKVIQGFIENAITIQAHIDASVESVKIAWIQSKAWSQMMAACEDLKETDDPLAVIQRVQGELSMMQTQSNQFCKAHHITEFCEAKVSAWRQAKGTGYVGIPSTFQKLNTYLGGYRRKVMTVLGGYRGEGKSTIARQEAHGIAKLGFRSLVVSLEDPEDIAQAGIAGNEASISVFHLDTGNGFDGNIDTIESAWRGMAALPLHTAAAMTIDEIVSLATIQKARHGLDFIVIDHLQYISPYTLPRMDRNGTIATYSQKICGLAKTLDVAVLVLSQFSRDSEKMSRRPKLSDLRDSGTIEQDARAVLLLSYDSSLNHHLLEVAKNNNGVSKVDIGVRRLDGKQRFEEVK